MTKNMGSADRVIRLLIAAIAVANKYLVHIFTAVICHDGLTNGVQTFTSIR